MADSFDSELRDLIDRVYVEDMGGRATIDQVRMAVWAELPEHLTHVLISKGLRQAIGVYFRRKNASGLPTAPEVNDAGEHVQLEFTSVTEQAFVYAQYLTAADASTAKAEKVRQLCLDTHGVDLASMVAAS